MIKKIVCFGCSYTAGHDSKATGREHTKILKEYPNGTTFSDFWSREHAYPALLEKMLNVPVMNAATLGNSNDNMYIDVTKWLNPELQTYGNSVEGNYIKENITKFTADKETLAIIGVTSPIRFIAPVNLSTEQVVEMKTTIYRFRENETYGIMNLGNELHQDYMIKYPNSIFSKQIYTNINTDEWWVCVRNLQSLNAIKQILSEKNIPYIFVNMLGYSMASYKNSDKRFNFYYDWFKNNCIENGTTIIDFFKNDPKLWSQYTHHPSVHGHEFIAKMLKNEIDSKFN
jgi:hypothetical protein